MYEGEIDLQWRNDTDTGVYVDTAWTPGAHHGRPSTGPSATRSRRSRAPRTNYREPAVQEKVDDGSCTPQAGVPGFDITVTRVFRDLASGAELRRENFQTRYAAEADHPLHPARPSPAPAPDDPAGRLTRSPARRSPIRCSAGGPAAGRRCLGPAASPAVHTGRVSTVCLPPARAGEPPDDAATVRAVRPADDRAPAARHGAGPARPAGCAPSRVPAAGARPDAGQGLAGPHPRAVRRGGVLADPLGPAAADRAARARWATSASVIGGGAGRARSRTGC